MKDALAREKIATLEAQVAGINESLASGRERFTKHDVILREVDESVIKLKSWAQMGSFVISTVVAAAVSIAVKLF